MTLLAFNIMGQCNTATLNFNTTTMIKTFVLSSTEREELVAKVQINCTLRMDFRKSEEGMKFAFFSDGRTIELLSKLFVELGITCCIVTDKRGYDVLTVKDKQYDFNIDENILFIYKKNMATVLEACGNF